MQHVLNRSPKLTLGKLLPNHQFWRPFQQPFKEDKSWSKDSLLEEQQYTEHSALQPLTGTAPLKLMLEPCYTSPKTLSKMLTAKVIDRCEHKACAVGAHVLATILKPPAS
eukprot:5730329-Amphidinium_carterae.1